jgi:cytochrome d ubiquinol oxidase subunit I
MALGTNLSAVLILIANGWMQDPVGAAFNPVTMRMELTDFWAVVFNPVAQAKFVHTVWPHVTGPFVLGISICSRGSTWSSPVAPSASLRPSVWPARRR